jgi:dTDP-4-dehydrorhamnose reductase
MERKVIWVTGANGQLGAEIRTLSQRADIAPGETFFFTDKETLDITNAQAVADFIKNNQITVIINCAAYTAVDAAESDQDMAYQINQKAVATLARLAKENRLQLIHLSTDYVFDGTGFMPYRESDPTNPQGIYAHSKWSGEEEIRRIRPPGACIIRTSWVYSAEGKNFVQTMMRLGRKRERLSVVDDQIGTPTYTGDLAGAILQIVQQTLADDLPDTVETYHYSNEGVCSWYDFAKAIFELADISCEVDPIPSSAYPTPAKRPHFSVLNKRKIKENYGLEIPYWRDSLKHCLATL